MLGLEWLEAGQLSIYGQVFRMATQIDTKAFEAELEALASPVKVKVKLDKRMDIATSIKETDKGFHIRLNPNKLRSPERLKEHLAFCREAVGRI